MQSDDLMLVGEFQRTLDDRFRLSLPPELGAHLAVDGAECMLAKERPGCLSLWSMSSWRSRWESSVSLVEAKMRAGKLAGKLGQVQSLGRLLSTRYRSVPLAGRSRLVVPEGFREFLRVAPGGEVVVVGACVCVELWSPPHWIEYVDRRMPRFARLLERLSD